jgi:phage terminase large subunit
MKLALEFPPSFAPLVNYHGRYLVAHGGRASGKSHSFARLLTARCVSDASIRAICAREVQLSLQQSVKALLESIIHQYSLWHYFRVMHNYIEILDDKRKPKGVIIFQGLLRHTAHSIKSLEAFDICWIEEGQVISKHSWDLVRPTIRKPGSQIWISFNPEFEDDPIDEFFRGPNSPINARVVEMNYKNNPWVSKETLEEAENDKRRDVESYNHIWGGDHNKKSTARVFKNWRIGTFEEFEGFNNRKRKPRYGADWGFANDPSVLVEVFESDCKKKLYITQEAVGLHIEVDELDKLFLQIENCDKWPIRADSNRPDTISYMQRNGFPLIRKAKKGPDSVKDGIEFLLKYEIIVHPECKHAQHELKHYSYEVDKLTGKILPILEDKKNHIIDSIRYAVEDMRAKGRVGTW